MVSANTWYFTASSATSECEDSPTDILTVHVFVEKTRWDSDASAIWYTEFQLAYRPTMVCIISSGQVDVGASSLPLSHLP